MRRWQRSPVRRLCCVSFAALLFSFFSVAPLCARLTLLSMGFFLVVAVVVDETKRSTKQNVLHSCQLHYRWLGCVCVCVCALIFYFLSVWDFSLLPFSRAFHCTPRSHVFHWFLMYIIWILFLFSFSVVVAPVPPFSWSLRPAVVVCMESSLHKGECRGEGVGGNRDRHRHTGSGILSHVERGEQGQAHRHWHIMSRVVVVTRSALAFRSGSQCYLSDVFNKWLPLPLPTSSNLKLY